MSAWLDALPVLWQQLDWRWPWAALLAAVPPLFAYAQRRMRQRTLGYADPHLRPWAIGALKMPRAHAARLWLEALGWMLLALALAGPRLPALQDVENSGAAATRQGAHIAVVVQISDSMHAADAAPDRLSRARLALQDGLKRLRGERLSLIAYGAAAGVLLPPTHDRALFAQALQGLDEDWLPTAGSNLGQALALALQQIRLAGERQNAVLLITDADPESLQGADGEAVQAAIDAMRAQRVPLYVWFAMPRTRAASEMMQPAADVADGMSDPESYRRLSSLTGGGTAYLADADFGWDDIYTRGIGALPAIRALQRVQGWEDLFAWPLALGWLLLALAYTPWPKQPPRISRPRTSASGRSRSVMAWLMVLGLLFFIHWPSAVFAQTARADTERRAWQAYQGRQWAEARRLYAQVGGYRGYWGAGLAALRAGRAADAAEQLGLAWMLAPDADKRLDALYNLAHAYAAMGRWDAAAEAWRTVLSGRPADDKAAANLKIALAELQRQRLKAGRPQDLYGHFGQLAEGRVEVDSGREPKDEPAGAGGGTGSTPPDAGRNPALQAGARQRPAFVLSENQLLSGQGKMNELSEQKAVLQKALMQQDAASLPAPGAPVAQGAAR